MLGKQVRNVVTGSIRILPSVQRLQAPRNTRVGDSEQADYAEVTI